MDIGSDQPHSRTCQEMAPQKTDLAPIPSQEIKKKKKENKRKYKKRTEKKREKEEKKKNKKTLPTLSAAGELWQLDMETVTWLRPYMRESSDCVF